MKENTRIEIERKARKLTRKAKQLKEIEEKLLRLRMAKNDLSQSLPDEIKEYFDYGLRVQRKDKPYTEERLQQSKVFNETLTEEKLQIFQAISNQKIEELIEQSNELQKFNYSSEKKLINLETIFERIKRLNLKESQDQFESLGKPRPQTTDYFQD